MRHHVAGSQLNRSRHHRQALFKNLAKSLIEHGAIVTTPAKAKAVQGLIDSLASEAKKGSVFARRQIGRVINDSKLLRKLVNEIAPITKRQSGFTRIVRLNQRLGDAAAQVRLEWVDTPEVKVVEKTPVTKKPVAKKTPKVKPAAVKKAALPLPKTPSQPELKPQATGSIRPGMIRQKSGER